MFLKEHARGLYSAYTNYTVFSIPLYVLKIINAMLFATVSWGIMDVDSSTGKNSVSLFLLFAMLLSGQPQVNTVCIVFLLCHLSLL